MKSFFVLSFYFMVVNSSVILGNQDSGVPELSEEIRQCLTNHKVDEESLKKKYGEEYDSDFRLSDEEYTCQLVCYAINEVKQLMTTGPNGSFNYDMLTEKLNQENKARIIQATHDCEREVGTDVCSLFNCLREKEEKRYFSSNATAN